MTFLSPLALLGLAAAAIPALLHLLQRRTPPEAEFPPVRYLSDAERRSARRLRLRHLWLLILRTALIVTVVLAAARPLVPARGGGAHQPTALAVVLDNSLSAAVVMDGRAALERLREAARQSLARATSADRLWLVLADGAPRAGTREELLATVAAAQPGAHRLDLPRAVERAARLVDAEPLPAREVHVYSDLQRTALDGPAADVPRAVRVLALAAGDRGPPNRGVAPPRVSDGALTVGVAGTAGAPAGALAARVGGREAGRALAAPGDAVTLPLPPLGPGWWVGEVALEPDELRADDARPFVWRVRAPARVAADPATGPFVAAALAVLREAGRVGAGTEVVIGDALRPAPTVLLPPADAALLGQVNRALAARGTRWRFGPAAAPGPIAAPRFELLDGVAVHRRHGLAAHGSGDGDTAAVLARVGGEPWLVRDGALVLLGSRLDTSWTALPASPAFVPFVDALVNRVARGEAAVAHAAGAPRVEFHASGADTVGATVYGPDPRESDLTAAGADAARRALGARVLEAGALAAERFAGARRADASGALLVLALLIAAAELGVARLTR